MWDRKKDRLGNLQTWSIRELRVTFLKFAKNASGKSKNDLIKGILSQWRKLDKIELEHSPVFN